MGKLKQLRLLLNDIYELKKKTDLATGTLLLLFFILNFYDSVYYAFLHIMTFKAMRKDFHFGFSTFMVQTAVVGMIARIALITSVCNFTYNQGKNIGVAVHQTYLKVEDPAVKQEVR